MPATPLPIMRTLVKDFSTHPLLPGSVLASIMGEPDMRELHVLDYPALIEFNKKGTLDVVAYFQNIGMINDEQAAKIIGTDNQFVNAFKDLVRRTPDVAVATGCEARSIEELARALLSAKLLAEHLEILTPPQLSYEKTLTGTVDLLDALFNAFRKIVGGAWAVFFPRSEFCLAADASAQFWMAILASNRTEEMVANFIGVFQREHKDRLQALNRGHGKEKRPRLQDAVTDYLDNSKEKISKLHDVVDSYVNEGLERAFQEISNVLTKLKLPPIVLFHYKLLTQQICESFSSMDGTITSRENRFTQYLLRQVAGTCDDYHAPLSGQAELGGQEKFERVLADLDELIGMESVKEKVKQTANFAKIQQVRRRQGLKLIPTSYHSVYTGNPGTGKTTVARLMGRIYKSLGVLKRGHLVECDRSSLVAEYVGQTAIKTNAVINAALDGILFIDEAYSLAKDNEDFGHEAIEAIIKRMEDNRDRLIVIVAGYPEEMERFIYSNPGLHSRFTRIIEFPDYSPQELCRIFSLMCRKNGLTLTPGLKEKILHHFTWLHEQRGENFGNARLVRNCFETVITAQATRLAGAGNYEPLALTTLEEADLVSPAEEFLQEYRKSGRGYVVKCPGCDELYAWTPELDLLEAQCETCNKTYHCEFGQLVG
ncbi:MAG: AAA family ATPase [Verrucomicrobiota bacterium]